jgi:hypothetical protein
MTQMFSLAARGGTPLFFLCPQSQHRNLKEAFASLNIRNFFMKYCISAVAIIFSSRLLQVRKVVEMMLRNCLSAYPQSQFFPAISTF